MTDDERVAESHLDKQVWLMLMNFEMLVVEGQVRMWKQINDLCGTGECRD